MTAVVLVAIDGPAGSGKSTIAQALARRLQLAHVDTGAFYRAATLAVLRAGADPDDARACEGVTRQLTIARRAGRTLLDGEDVEDEIRGRDVTAAVSAVSVHPGVRAALLTLQREAVPPAGAVVEGRDAGTVIVPEADTKVWLTADPAERAARRGGQLGRSGPNEVTALTKELRRRDDADAAQMARAQDAIVVDTTGRTVDDVVAELAQLVGHRTQEST